MVGVIDVYKESQTTKYDFIYREYHWLTTGWPLLRKMLNIAITRSLRPRPLVHWSTGGVYSPYMGKQNDNTLFDPAQTIYCRITTSGEQLASKVALGHHCRWFYMSECVLRSIVYPQHSATAWPLVSLLQYIASTLCLRPRPLDHWSTGEDYFPYRSKPFDKRYSQQCVVLSSSFYF